MKPPTREEQTELICAALDGDQDAYSEIHRRYKSKVQSVLRSFAKDDTDLEDLVQDAFMRIFSKLPTFEGEANFSTWIHRVAFNVGAMRYRNEYKKLEATAQSLDAMFDPESEDGAPWEPSCEAIEYEFAGDIDKLRDAIKQLPDGYRTVVEAKMEGVEHKQIAAALGCTVGNSKSQMNKGITKLKSIMLKGKPMFTTEYDVPTEALTEPPTTPTTEPVTSARKCKCGCGEAIGARGWPYKTGHTPAGVRSKKNQGLKEIRKDNPASRIATVQVVKPATPAAVSPAALKLGIIIAASRGDIAEVVKLVATL